MLLLGIWRLFDERPRLYAASLLVGIARALLWSTHLLFRVGILDIAGIKYAIFVSGKVRNLGWRLVKRKRNSDRAL